MLNSQKILRTFSEGINLAWIQGNIILARPWRGARRVKRMKKRDLRISNSVMRSIEFGREKFTQREFVNFLLKCGFLQNEDHKDRFEWKMACEKKNGNYVCTGFYTQTKFFVIHVYRTQPHVPTDVMKRLIERTLNRLRKYRHNPWSAAKKLV